MTTFPTSHCATQALFLKSLSQSQAWLFLMKLKSEKRNWEGLLFLASSKRVSIMAKKEWAFEDLRKGQKRPLIWRGHHLVMQQLMLHSAILMALFFVCFLRKTLVKFSYTLQFDYFLTVNSVHFWVFLSKIVKYILWLFQLFFSFFNSLYQELSGCVS